MNFQRIIANAGYRDPTADIVNALLIRHHTLYVSVYAIIYTVSAKKGV